MMDLGSWLRSLGLEHYEAAFRKNDIGADVLHDLTGDHLREMGLPLGARLKLLKAIGELAPGAEPVAPTAPIVPAGEPADAAERRQVTVMFSDLVGSTALAARMDPEDLREVIAAYHKCVAEVVRGYDGFVAQYLGDGVLVYFGYPQAHEDDAERAVRAALELVAAVVALKTRVVLQARIGIATGLVVVGDLMDSGNAPERGIVGETPNLAARLQGFAKPNTVVVAEDTRKLLGNLFELEDLGPREVKSIDGQVRPWAVVRASSAEGRFEALHASGLTALVGREEETELLLRRWARAKAGEGQVVLLSGEAGIGKSRLAAALSERLVDEPHTRQRYFCSPQHTDSAFFPIIGQAERAAGLTHDDTPAAKLDKLDTLLARTATSQQDAALLAGLLSLPDDGRYPALDLPPDQRRHRTLQLLITRMEALARQNPVLMIFEDAHWSDPTSLELFGRVVNRIAKLRMLLIVTFRPEFAPPWIGLPHVTARTINRLSQREIAAMIDRVVGNKFIEAGIRQDIIERTDGIPLFVEEITKAMLEAQSERAAERPGAAIPSPAVAVPASLHASLMARLDRLGAAKELAQTGAAIGREFSHALLAAVTRQPEAELNRSLDRLVAAGLLFRHGVPPHATYLFKHALVQDTAYGMLLRDHRRSLHARIADVIETQFTEIAEGQPELLARHCTEARLDGPAIEWWGKAGDQALRRSGFKEAAAHFGKAIELADKLAASGGTIPGAASGSNRLHLQTSLGNALIWAKGHHAPETSAAFARVRELANREQDASERFSAYYGLWVGHHTRCEPAPMREMAELFLREATARPDCPEALVSHRVSGVTCFYFGDYAAAHDHFRKTVELYDPARHRQFANRFGQDPRPAAEIFDAMALWVLGTVDDALQLADRALADAESAAHAPTMGHALAFSALLGLLRSNPEAVATHGQALADVVSRYDLGAAFAGMAAFFQGWTRWSRGEDPVGLADMRRGIGIYRKQGLLRHLAAFEPPLAEAEARAGDTDAGLRRLDDALAELERTQERWYEAEMHRIRADILLMRDPANNAAAEQSLQAAIAVAQSQKARSFELRAALVLARLYRSANRDADAHGVLAPAVAGFPPTGQLRELAEAQAFVSSIRRQ